MVVKSRGRYPTKSKTLVADVCRYQNDGTTRGITPAQFIERAEYEALGWKEEIDRGLSAFLAGNGDSELKEAAKKVASDISRVCDRVKTGRLKASFDGMVEHV